MLQKCANVLKYIKKSTCTLFSVFVFRDRALLTVFDPFLNQIKVIWSWSDVVLMCANGSWPLADHYLHSVSLLMCSSNQTLNLYF